MTTATPHPQVGPTIGTITERALRRHPDRVAFSWDGGELTYRGALVLIGELQAALHASGLHRGRTLALLGGNRAEMWCTGAAATASGMAVTWLHPLASIDDQFFQLTDADAAALVVDERTFAARGEELAHRCADAGIPVFSIEASSFAPDLRAIARSCGGGLFADVAEPGDVVNIGYTGGTTGRPKGAVRRHAANIALQQTILAEFQLPSVPRLLAVAPISHVAGSKVLPTLIRGGTVHLVTGFDPDRVVSTIARERLNCTLLVPSMIYALLDHAPSERADLSSLELILYGASPMSPTRLAEGLDRFGPVFAQMFGQTECYPISFLRTGDHRVEHPELLGSCGVPLSGVSVSIRGEDGSPVPAGEPGELCVRAATTMEGYRNQPDLTRKTLADGWLHTGDIARADERGYLYIVDRKKDMIISGGFNVFSRGVEDALTTHPAVAGAAVYGTPDPRWGESVTATVVLKPDAAVAEDELVAHVRSVKGSLQAPKRILFTDRLPLTALGKVDKRRLREEWDQGNGPRFV
ncbi:AMP-binding protein [Prescottella defluvii]|uniref:AMP-binding protein n=1 Tax=Prescottella defluvii TaxID=1323361 RepID=UPI000691667E|nr:AMP-binding protein [Prescottella defluvii]